jgi:hypothetical protein
MPVQVHIFKAAHWSGVVRETEEIAPRWFHVSGMFVQFIFIQTGILCTLQLQELRNELNE